MNLVYRWFLLGLYFTAECNVAMIKRQKEADLSDVYEVREQIISTTGSGRRRFRFITSLTCLSGSTNGSDM